MLSMERLTANNSHMNAEAWWKIVRSFFKSKDGAFLIRKVLWIKLFNYPSYIKLNENLPDATDSTESYEGFVRRRGFDISGGWAKLL